MLSTKHRLIPSQTIASYALSKNLDWSPLQQPQNALTKTRTNHPYSSPKMLFQKPELITLTVAPKCSFKKPDWSPLQQPQNALSKTWIDHPCRNPKILFQKPGLIILTAVPKCPFKTRTDPSNNSLKNAPSKHGLIPQILTNESLTSSLKRRLISSKQQPQKCLFQNLDWFLKCSQMTALLLLWNVDWFPPNSSLKKCPVQNPDWFLKFSKMTASLLSFSSVPSPNMHPHSPEWCGYRSLNGASLTPRLAQLFSNFLQGCFSLFKPPSLFFIFIFLNTTSLLVHIHVTPFSFTCQNPDFLIFFP